MSQSHHSRAAILHETGNKKNAIDNEDFSSNGKDRNYCPETIKEKKKIATECGFCKNNGEVPHFYKSHTLRNGRGKINCPVLRAYTCPICNNEGGDNAHTIRYCPENKSQNQIPFVLSLKTLRSSTGKIKKTK
ncbi:nanos homolog 1-like [Centruroides sculpturatus]|uniref:nanos homolog 1-like n=1 Tax=Centruroides sculpturatus TaxID=218467 RepID=UPI000C6D63D2|nr:nanos homolog 1-like [Centruroides sculpturatus]